MLNVRFYKNSDFPVVSSWFDCGLAEVTIPSSSFICEVDGVPAIFVTAIITNIPLVWLESLQGNPEVPKEKRREGTVALLDHISAWAKIVGARGFFCVAPNEGLKKYYEHLGFKESSKVIATMLKEVV